MPIIANVNGKRQQRMKMAHICGCVAEYVLPPDPCQRYDFCKCTHLLQLEELQRIVRDLGWPNLLLQEKTQALVSEHVDVLWDELNAHLQEVA